VAGLVFRLKRDVRRIVVHEFQPAHGVPVRGDDALQRVFCTGLRAQRDHDRLGLVPDWRTGKQWCRAKTDDRCHRQREKSTTKVTLHVLPPCW
jgi:hypothetical protein